MYIEMAKAVDKPHSQTIRCKIIFSNQQFCTFFTAYILCQFQPRKMLSRDILLTVLLLASTNLTHFASASLVGAHPLSIVSTRQIKPDLEARDPELQVRGGPTLGLGGEPPMAANCPATSNPAGNSYPQHDYTVGQVKSAMYTAANLYGANQQIGLRSITIIIPVLAIKLTRFIEYPHVFGNNEELPFTCGSNKIEFPIQMDGQLYTGGDVTSIPDRVVFEAKLNSDGSQLALAYCGVMRHGPPVQGQRDKFISCPA
jgi:hypothetical protein